MKLTIKIEMDNAAFVDGDNGTEVSRILKRLSSITFDNATLETGQHSGLSDINGNTCGSWKVTGR